MKNMFLNKITIRRDSFVNDIVKADYRAAAVFRKYDIEYCCGGRWPLETVCQVKDLTFDYIKKELETACRIVHLPTTLLHEKWSLDFLTSYIINVHHQYLKNTMPDTEEMIGHFAESHKKQYPFMQEVVVLFQQLNKKIFPHIAYEEDTIFPYICQVAHAYENNDVYAKLLVKTLRKPLGGVIRHEENALSAIIDKIRLLTNNYFIPENACVSHGVALARLQELDNDLMQHIYLENEILFPRATDIEKDLLQQ